MKKVTEIQYKRNSKNTESIPQQTSLRKVLKKISNQGKSETEQYRRCRNKKKINT